SRSVTSAATAIAFPPIAAATRPARSACRSLTTTAAPWPASAWAMPSPTPCPAPVTSATRPLRSNTAEALDQRADRVGRGVIGHREPDPVDQPVVAGRDLAADLAGLAGDRDRLDHVVGDEPDHVVPTAFLAQPVELGLQLTHP